MSMRTARRQTSAHEQASASTSAGGVTGTRLGRRAARPARTATDGDRRSRAGTARPGSGSPSEVDRHPPCAVGDRLADGDRRPERQPDQRRAGRPARSAKRRARPRRATMRAGAVAHCPSGIDRGRRSPPGSTNSASATAAISRPSRARIALVSSHACEIDKSAHATPSLAFAGAYADAAPRRATALLRACARAPSPARREAHAGRHRMARQRRAGAL